MLATAITLPLVLVLALLLVTTGGSSGSGSSGPSASATALPAISAPAPQVSDSATVSSCAQVIGALPVQLGPLPARPALAERTVAWGNPAIVLRCGVTRPPQLVPGSDALLVDVRPPTGTAVEWLPVKNGQTTVFTTVDRAIYVEVDWPAAQSYNPLPEVSRAVAAALPAVCTTGPTVADDQLCTHRN